MQKVVVVSGGAGYVGSAIVHRLRIEGYAVAPLYKTNKPEAGGYPCDLADVEAVREVLSQIESELGAIYAVVHAAGTMPLQKKLSAISTSELESEIHQDTLPAFTFLSSAAKKLAAHKE